MRLHYVLICLGFAAIAVALPLGCNRGSASSDGEKPESALPATAMAPSDATTEDASSQRYLMLWRMVAPTSEGGSPSFKTTVYELHGDDEAQRLGEIDEVVLVGHEQGITSLRHAPLQVKGCGNCEGDDPVAACEADPVANGVTFTRHTLVATPPQGLPEIHAYVPAPSMHEALSSHQPSFEIWGEVGPYLFLSDTLDQVKCGAGEAHFEERVVIDARTGKRVVLFDEAALQAMSQDDALMGEALAQAKRERANFSGPLAVVGAQPRQIEGQQRYVYLFQGACDTACAGPEQEAGELVVEVARDVPPKLLEPWLAQAPSAALPLLSKSADGTMSRGWSQAEVNEDTTRVIESWLKK